MPAGDYVTRARQTIRQLSAQELAQVVACVRDGGDPDRLRCYRIVSWMFTGMNGSVPGEIRDAFLGVVRDMQRG